MLNLLMIENDAEKFKYILNTISHFDLDLKLYNISFTGREALEVIKAYNIDLILLDSNITDMSIIELLNIVENEYKYKNSVIIISDDVKISSQLIKYSCINKIIKNVKDIELIKEHLIKFILNHEIEEYKIKEKIKHELLYLKYNLFNKGTTYLCETIYLLYCIKGYNIKLNSVIYPIIAYKYDTTIINVKSNIIRASLNCYMNCEEKRLSDYLEKQVIEKPSTIEIIMAIIKHINGN